MGAGGTTTIDRSFRIGSAVIRAEGTSDRDMRRAARQFESELSRRQALAAKKGYSQND